jgi:hypothetical protein
MFSHGHVAQEKVVQSEVLHLSSILDLSRDHSRFGEHHRMTDAVSLKQTTFGHPLLGIFTFFVMNTLREFIQDN